MLLNSDMADMPSRAATALISTEGEKNPECFINRFLRMIYRKKKKGQTVVAFDIDFGSGAFDKMDVAEE